MFEYLGLARRYEDGKRHLPHVGLGGGIPEDLFYVIIDAQGVVFNVLGVPHCGTF